MAQKIDSDKLLIKDVFNKWYRIPEYQRPYVWEKDQVFELLDDITSAQANNPKSQYFLGSMVLKASEIKEAQATYEEFDLLDGQQRLTTLFLITAVIRDMTSDSSRRNSCQTTIFQQANPDDNIPERLRIEFNIRSKVADFIETYIKEPGGTSRENELRAYVNNKGEDTSIINMAQAILTIREFFSGPQGNIDTFYPFLRSNVLMIYVATEELDDAFKLFTVMNSRGVKLRNSDILKAGNLGAITNDKKRVEYAKKWEDTETYFGEEFDTFLSHLRTILVKQKATVSLLKEFEENIYNPKIFDRVKKVHNPAPPLLNKGEDTFKFIFDYKTCYEKLFEEDHYSLTQSFELYNYLHLMQKGFEADLWIPPLLRFYDKFKTDELVPFVKALDNKFANDWLRGNTPTSRIENINAIIQAIDLAITSSEVIQGDSLKLDEDDLIVAISGKIYGKRAARYILLKLDLQYHGHTTKFTMPETISIEHILPQKPAKDSQWANDFTEDQIEEWKDKVGNLVLISRRKNSSQGNRDYEEKKERYFKGNIELFSNSIRIYQKYKTWNLTDIEKNQTDAIEQLAIAFGI